VAGLRCQFDKDAATVVRVGLAEEQALLNHGFQSTKRRRRRNCRSNAQARYGHPQPGKFGLKQVEQHVPRGARKKLLGEVVAAKAPRADNRAYGLDGNV